MCPASGIFSPSTSIAARLNSMPAPLLKTRAAKRFDSPAIHTARSVGRSGTSRSTCISIEWLSVAHPSNSARHAFSSEGGAPAGRIASTRGSPKIWPMDGGVSRGSSLRNTSKRGSTCSASGSASVASWNACAAPSSRTTFRSSPFTVCTTTGTSTANGGPPCVCRSVPRTTFPLDTSTPSTASTGAPGRPTQSSKKRPKSRPLSASIARRRSSNDARFPLKSR